MLVFPNCKINLGLNTVAKRSDGYHDLETIFYPIPFCDALEIIQSPIASVADETASIRFSTSGLPVAGKTSSNLCVKAYQLIKNDFPQLPKVQTHLHKFIPMGAGLGGGSSDGAFALQLLNNTFGLGLTENQLLDYALQLGSDCPFFIINKPCFATGRGEKLQRVDLDLKGLHLVLINPAIHVSTREAFAAIKPASPAIQANEIVAKPMAEWKQLLTNDFEAGVFNLYPELAAIKQALYNAGAVYASMTGTGSTVFGIFQSPTVNLPAFDPAYLVKQIAL